MSSLLVSTAIGLDDPIRAYLEPRLRGAASEAAAETTLAVTVPAPVAPAEALLDLAPSGHGFLWHPPGEAAVAGSGACHALRLEGAGRFADLRRRAEEVFRSLEEEVHPEAALPAAGVSPARRLYGGLAFDVGAASQEPWTELGDGCFTLPRFLYRVDGERASLTVSARASQLAAGFGVEAALDETSRLLDGLGRYGGTGTGPLASPAPVPEHGEDGEPPDAEDWIRRVEAIRRAIRAGDFEKIVAARRSVIDLGHEPRRQSSAVEILGRLERDQVASTRFAFVRPNAVFLGVTPERLVAKKGLRVVTEALAGSIESGAEHAAELLGSGKDRLEQQLVVDAIVRRLEPVCDRLQVAARPTVRELRDVLHLHTPIVGTLAEPRHLLELVETLHPTPAVGGVPTAEAMEWIREHETHERGWYAAPIGWFDAAGDGEMAVALRSCVISGSRAYLYVGAGIVADSDPRQELRETELKKQALSTVFRG
ncbi:MAG: isochorismate synthase [Holophagales bacterium]|nr:isochorismate synthase [Holophagales bacterium]